MYGEKDWLEAHKKDKYVCDPVSLPYRLNIQLDEKDRKYQSVIKAITGSRRRGEFTFNEMELYAAKEIDENQFFLS